MSEVWVIKGWCNTRDERQQGALVLQGPEEGVELLVRVSYGPGKRAASWGLWPQTEECSYNPNPDLAEHAHERKLV